MSKTGEFFMSSPEHKAKIWNIVKEIKVGMLTTSDGNDLRSRPMQLTQDDYDGTIWLFTKLDDPKAEEVEDEHQVCITFSDVHNDTHASSF